MFSDLASCFCFGANNCRLDFCPRCKRLDMALIFGFGEGVSNIWFGLCLYFCNTYQSGCWVIVINKWFGLYFNFLVLSPIFTCELAMMGLVFLALFFSTCPNSSWDDINLSICLLYLVLKLSTNGFISIYALVLSAMGLALLSIC